MRFRAELALLLILAACAGGRGRPGVLDYPVKVGQPYQVQGRWYYPRDDTHYDAVGMASWYGPGFHGLTTANGEPYDMNGMTAAHKTLPLPSYVEVTNISNGQKQIVRVNDRGPFVDGRVIDLSRQAAAVLGVQRMGVAKVRVRRVYPPESVRLALRSGAAVGPAQTAAFVPPPPVAPAPQRTILSPTVPPVRTVDLPPAIPAPVATGTIFIQVAAVSDAGKAEWLAGYLKPFGAISTQSNGAGLIRVRVGPYATREAASEVLAKVREAGYQEAMIVAGPSSNHEVLPQP